MTHTKRATQTRVALFVCVHCHYLFCAAMAFRASAEAP
ncbi:MAG: hypothetical protein IKA28_00355, partial [Tidjanibacter sp.]|nr:hypothetical protein [Tidjanibacter sp.]